jgi:hypothetical protein
MVRATRTYALCFPFLLVASFFLPWLAARLALGHWPRPSFNDPSEIGLWVKLLSQITTACLMVGLPTFVVAVCALLYFAYRKPLERAQLLTSAAAAILFMMAAMTFFRWDPLHVFDWFMD